MKTLFSFTLILLILSSCKEEKSMLITLNSDTSLLKESFGMCSDAEGNLYVADAGHNCIKKISTIGEITIYAGTGEEGFKDGLAAQAQFNNPSGVCIDDAGNLYIAGFGGQRVRKISPDGIVTTIAGTGKEGYKDGPGDSAMFSSPRGVCRDSKGNLYIGDCWNHRIRKIYPDGYVTTFAGGGKIGELVDNAWKDGKDTSAMFNAPCGMAIDEFDNIYVADANNNCIRKITPEGIVSTLAGIGGQRAHKDGLFGISILNCPTELYVNSDGIIYFSDSYGNLIRKINEENFTSTLAGNGNVGYKDTLFLNSELSSPRGITVIKNKVYFVDYGNNVIRYFKIKRI